MSNISIDALASEINELISDYGKHCTSVTKECVEKVARKTVTELKKNSPGCHRKVQKRLEENDS